VGITIDALVGVGVILLIFLRSRRTAVTKETVRVPVIVDAHQNTDTQNTDTQNTDTQQTDTAFERQDPAR